MLFEVTFADVEVVLCVPRMPNSSPLPRTPVLKLPPVTLMVPTLVKTVPRFVLFWMLTLSSPLLVMLVLVIALVPLRR